MFRCWVTAAAVASALVGCVPVTEPVGDLESAEPDVSLIGTWTHEGGKKDNIVIDVPKVKGNPKGLMRVNFRENSDGKPSAHWFFVTAVGKEKFGNACVELEDEDTGWVYFEKEGAYPKWAKGKGRAYLVFRYSVDRESIIVNFGDERETKKIMKTQGIEATSANVFKTPAGWLGNYLKKSGANTLFAAAQSKKLTRSMK